MVGAWGFQFSRGKSLVWNRGKKKEGKEINGEGNGSITVK